MTSQTAPTSVDTVARPQNMASTRRTGKPSTTLDRTTTAPAAYASARVGTSGPPTSSKADRVLADGVQAPAASSGKS